jgi:broad specificity phosphatase PhoE
MDNYRDAVARSLTAAAEPGWERRDEVAARFSAAVEEARTSQTTGDLVVVSHGQAISLYLRSRIDIDIVSFWRSLLLPDAWRFDTETGSLDHLYAGGQSAE